MYYRARYYDPSLGQFISPDTIVPEPSNVLDYNRYLYVRGNAINFNDPSGHCAGDSVSDEGYDASCWNFLENEFCDGIDCVNGAWESWVTVGNFVGDTGFNLVEMESRWTKEQLLVLRDTLRATKRALGKLGESNWRSAIGAPKFQAKTGSTDANAFFSPKTGNITILSGLLAAYGASGSSFVIAHEIGHAIDHSLGGVGTLGSDFLEATGNSNFNRFKGNCMRGDACRNNAEGWGDAFAALVTDNSNGYIEPQNTYRPIHGPRYLGYNYNWGSVVVGAQKALLVNLQP